MKKEIKKIKIERSKREVMIRSKEYYVNKIKGVPFIKGKKLKKGNNEMLKFIWDIRYSICYKETEKLRIEGKRYSRKSKKYSKMAWEGEWGVDGKNTNTNNHKDIWNAKGWLLNAECLLYSYKYRELIAKVSRMEVFGDKIWAEAVLKVYGNIKFYTVYSSKTKTHICYLENGEYYE